MAEQGQAPNNPEKETETVAPDFDLQKGKENGSNIVNRNNPAGGQTSAISKPSTPGLDKRDAGNLTPRINKRKKEQGYA